MVGVRVKCSFWNGECNVIMHFSMITLKKKLWKEHALILYKSRKYAMMVLLSCRTIVDAWQHFSCWELGVLLRWKGWKVKRLRCIVKVIYWTSHFLFLLSVQIQPLCRSYVRTNGHGRPVNHGTPVYGGQQEDNRYRYRDQTVVCGRTWERHWWWVWWIDKILRKHIDFIAVACCSSIVYRA